jgi:ankyrin repeat protein
MPFEMSTIIIIAAGGVGFIFWEIWILYLRHELRKRGKHATATVVDVKVSYSGGKRKSRSYVNTLEFMAESERRTVTHRTKWALVVGDKLDIAYLPEKPSRFMLAELLPNTFGNIWHFAAKIGGGVFSLAYLLYFSSGYSRITQNVPPGFPQLTSHSQKSANIFDSGTPQQVEEAIQGGADVNARGDDGETPLMTAASRNNDPELSRMLIKAGADVGARDDKGRTPLILAAEKRNKPEVINVLIQSGADVNASDNDGRTALMFAATFGVPDNLNILIQEGADVNAKRNNGWTALMYAAANNSNPEIFRMLIQAGADVNANGNDGDTPLMIAARGSRVYPEVLSVLIQAGADINAKNNVGWTPLMGAAGNTFNHESLNVLIQSGADINAKNNDGKTPLMMAVANYRKHTTFSSSVWSEKPNPEVFNVLIQAGADVNANDNDGNTPLMQIADLYNTNPEVMSIFLQAGADVNAKNNDGRTPLNFAVKASGPVGPVIVSILLAAGAEVSESDVELAQKNSSLKDTVVIEELKSRVK